MQPILLVALGRVAHFLLLLVMLRASTTLLPPAELGRVTLITTATAFFAYLFLNPVGMYINRHLHAWETAGQIAGYFYQFRRYVLIVSSIAVIVLGLTTWSGVYSLHVEPAWLFVLVGGSLLFGTANQVYIPSLNLLGYRGWYIVLTLATTVSGLVLAVLLTTQLGYAAEFWLLGILAGQFLLAGLGQRIFNRKVQQAGSTLRKTDNSRPDLSAVYHFAWPIAITAGLGWVHYQGYRFLLEGSLGLRELGLYVAGYGIGIGIMAAYESIQQTYFQPAFYRAVSQGGVAEQSQAWSQYAGAIFPSLILLLFFSIATAQDLTGLLLGPDYQTASRYAVWGMLAEAMRVIAGVFVLAAHARKKTYLTIAPNILGAVLAILLVFILMPSFGADGVGLGVTIASVGVVIGSHWLLRREMTLKLPIRSFVQCLGIGIVLALSIAGLKLILGTEYSRTTSAGLIATTGIALLVIQYHFIQPYLHSGRAQVDSGD